MLVTISTVGYGDQYPVTGSGRLIGVLIIVIGVGIFGTFTGYLANLFLSPSKKDQPEETVPPEPDDPRADLERLKLLLAQQQAAVEEIERKLQHAGVRTEGPEASDAVL